MTILYPIRLHLLCIVIFRQIQEKVVIEYSGNALQQSCIDSRLAEYLIYVRTSIEKLLRKPGNRTALSLKFFLYQIANVHFARTIAGNPKPKYY